MEKNTQFKDSGIEWLGKIPAKWPLKRLKFAARVRFSGVDKKSEEGEQQIRLCNYVDVYYNDRITSGIDFMVATASSQEIERFRLRQGDVLVTKDSEEWDDIAIPAYVAENFEDVICGYHLAQIRPCEKLINGRFLFWLLASHRLNHQFKVEATGITRYGLSNYALSNGIVLLPSLEEQKFIADYLDHKTVQIDDLIAKKKRMIELLKEERTAIINQAVTKGLDPKAEIKDSGIEWLGEIPKHWAVKRLKYLVNGRLEYGANEVAELNDISMPRYIRITDFDEDGCLRDDTFKSLSEDIARGYLLKEGDVLFARSGATVGKTFQFKDYKGKACFAGYLIKASPNAKMLSDFLYYFTKSNAYENWKNSIFNQATIQNIGADKYSMLPLPIPSIKEQKEIVDFIQTACGRIDGIIIKEKKSVELLKEYRTALISETVTGKIDVRV